MILLWTGVPSFREEVGDEVGGELEVVRKERKLR
jgi:hypothetical protein